MRHLVDHRKLGRTASHRKALLRNLATSLVLAERIETTLPKALEVRRVADKLITLAKAGSLHARRQAASILQDEAAVKKLFDGLGQRFVSRQGGYTRIYKFGFRRGDSAEMAAIEYLGFQLPEPKKDEEKADQKKGKENKKEMKKAAKQKVEKAAKKAEKASKKAEGTGEAKTAKKTADKKSEKKEASKVSEKKGKWGLFGRGKDKE
jgi:large subunit ribosomal protein L17